MEFLTLDWYGAILAILLGIGLLVLGLGAGIFFVAAMIVFLFLSAIVTWMGMKYKNRLGLGQKPRGVKNVLSNGLPPLIFATMFYLFYSTGGDRLAFLSFIGFIASVASITADKFSSEIGVLNGNPRMIFTLEKVKKGTSGAVTALGAFAGLAGAFLIALLIFGAPHIAIKGIGTLSTFYLFSWKKSIFVITFAGFMGSLADTLLGYYEEKGIGNKYTTNFVCGIVGGLVAMVIFMVF